MESNVTFKPLIVNLQTKDKNIRVLFTKLESFKNVYLTLPISHVSLIFNVLHLKIV